jgi:GNAT superfamily N-acetyltransferase
MARRIELLDGQHRRDSFDCGDATLNDFLRRLAGQQQRRGFGKTYVALADDNVTVVGFVTVSIGQVATQTLPSHLKLPRYPAPMFRIGRLGVDSREQGKGVGQDLLAFALHLALEFSSRVGLYAAVVDAKDDKAAAFYRRLGFEPTLDNPLCLFLPLTKLAKVGTGRTATNR